MLNLNDLKKLYANSPLWIKKLYASIPYRIRNGGDYRKWTDFLAKNIDLEEYKLLKMKETVLYAYENTEYYKKLFNTMQISPFDINDINDFGKLPLIDKNIVKENFEELIVQNYPSNKKYYVTTGGTSGTPMKFLQSNNIWAKELAFVMSYFGQFGFDSSSLKASLRGGEFESIRDNNFWKFNPIHNEIHFSPFHINEKSVYYYVKAMNKFKPEFWHSYPSSVLLLIEHMKNQELELSYQLKTIFLISENFSIKNIKTIQSFFNCKVSSFYGHSERLIFAPNCHNNLFEYKVNERYGMIELIDEASNIINLNGERGEIVGSSFDNYAMPLIRYKTNDFTHYVDSKNKSISAIEGKWKQEYLLGKENLKIYLTAVNMHNDIFENVIEYQFIQNRIGFVTLNIVVSKFFTDNDKKSILISLKQKAGHALTFDICIVKQLKLTNRGKFKNIIKSKTLE